MATKKISELDSASTPLAGTELLEIVQGGASKKVAASELGGGGGGGGGGSVAAAFRAVKASGNQAITDATETAVIFDSEIVDTDEIFAANIFTVPASLDGKYAILSAGVRKPSGAIEAGIYIKELTSGEYVAQQAADSGTITGGLAVSSGLIQLEEGQTYGVFIYTGAGSSTSIAADPRTFFAGVVFHEPGAAPDDAVAVPFKGCRAKRTTNASNSGAQVVAWTAEDFDYGGWHDNATNNTRFTVPDGVTRIRMAAQLDLQSPSSWSLQVRKNGVSAQIATHQVGTSGFSFTVAQIDTGIIEVTPGDYFEVYLETSATIIGTSGRTWCVIEAISEKLELADLSADLNTQTGAAYTLTASDNNNLVEMSSGSANTVTIPANATESLPVGSMFSITQVGAGATTIQADAGVTLNGVSEGAATISGQWGGVSLYKRATDAWVIQGAHGGVA